MKWSLGNCRLSNPPYNLGSGFYGSRIEIYVNSALMWIKSSSVFIMAGNLFMSGCDIERQG